MSESYNEFQERVARIYAKQGDRKQLRKNTRAIYRQGQDGYTVIRTTAPRRPFPWLGLMLIAATFFGIKGAVMANTGSDFFKSHVAGMAPTTLLEQVRHWTMQPDPISEWVAKQIRLFS